MVNLLPLFFIGAAEAIRPSDDIAGKQGVLSSRPRRERSDLSRDRLARSVPARATGQAPYRYNEAGLLRAWADNCSPTRQFLLDNYVRMGRISGTHCTGGMSRARRAVCFLMEGDVTDIKAGTVSTADAGIDGASSSHFAPPIRETAWAQSRPARRPMAPPSRGR
jgi:hypothetical protein